MKRLSILIAFAAMLSMLLVPAVQAVTITPIIFDDVDLQPGDATYRYLTVVNDTEEEQTYYLFARNFEPTGETGNVTIALEQDYGLATWVVFPYETVTIEPGEYREVELTIVPPLNAEPGGHYAAVFASTTPPDLEEGVSLGGNVGALMLVRIEGDITEDVRLLEFGTMGNKKWYNRLPVELYYRIENRGTVHIKPKGVIRMDGWFGTTEINANPSQSRNLPSSIRRVETYWTKDKEAVEAGGFFTELKNEWNNFAFGKYKAVLDIEYGKDKKTIAGETSFWVIPWRVILVAVVLLLAIIAILLGYNKMVIAAARKKGKV